MDPLLSKLLMDHRSKLHLRLRQWFMSNGISAKGKENLPLSHRIQSRPPHFLNSFSERSLGAAGSRPSPRLGQGFMSNGIRHMDFISINSACYQSLTEDLFWIKGLLVSGKESQTLMLKKHLPSRRPVLVHSVV